MTDRIHPEQWATMGTVLDRQLAIVQVLAGVASIGDEENVVTYARAQIAHIREYRKLPLDPRLSAMEHKVGDILDRLIVKTSEQAIELVEVRRLPAKLAAQREARARLEAQARERELARGERIAARRAEAASVELATPVETKLPKREKREVALCIACGKRSQKIDRRCKQCHAWGARAAS